MSAKKKIEVVEETVTAEDINETFASPEKEAVKDYPLFFCDNHYHSSISGVALEDESKHPCMVCGEKATVQVSAFALMTLTLRLLGKVG